MTRPHVFEKQLFAGWGDMDFNSLPQTDDFQVLPGKGR